MLTCLIFNQTNAEENQFSSSSINQNQAIERNDPTKPKKTLNNHKSSTNNSKIIENSEEELLNLSLIIISENDKTATINKKTLREKDHIDGLEIISIENNKVLLQPITTNEATKEQQLIVLANSNNFINKNLVNGYIELRLPKKNEQQSITISDPMKMINNKNL